MVTERLFVDTLTYTAARSRLANLSRTRPHDDPEIVHLRRVMREQLVVHKVSQALAEGPALTVGMREQIIGTLDAHMTACEVA